MIEWATWIAVVILGPGSIVVFAWFLRDLKKIFSLSQKKHPDGGDA